jgi:hypothetical protein
MIASRLSYCRRFISRDHVDDDNDNDSEKREN